jgi:hypothetical protein
MKKVLSFVITALVILLDAYCVSAAESALRTTYYIEGNVPHGDLLRQSAERSRDASTFHVFTHGKPGQLLIDGSWKDARQLAAIFRGFLADSPGILQLNLYGCEFGKGPAGQQAVSYLQQVLGVRVAASDDITGKDGDWDLEAGNAADVVVPVGYVGNLQCRIYELGGENGDSKVLNKVTATYYEGRVGAAKLDGTATGKQLGNTVFTNLETSDSRGFNGNDDNRPNLTSDGTVQWSNYLVTRVRFSDAQRISGKVTIEDIDGLKDNGASGTLDNREMATIFGIDADGKLVEPTLTVGDALKMQDMLTKNDPPFPAGGPGTLGAIKTAIVRDNWTYDTQPGDGDADYKLTADFGTQKVEWVYFMWAQVEAQTNKVTAQHAGIDMGCLENYVVCEAPVGPAVSNISICSGESVDLNTLATCSGAGLKWYTAASGGTALANTTVMPGATRQYYAECVSNSGCSSERKAVKVTVEALPAAPTTKNASICSGESIDLNTLATCSGADLKWYTTSSGGAPLTDTGVSPAETSTYYAECVSNSGCESSRVSVTVTVEDCNCSLEIGGRVYMDTDGGGNGVNGTVVDGTTLGIYISLLRDGTIQNTVQIAADGTYRFKEVQEGAYGLVLGTTSGGSISPSLPNGLAAVAEGGSVDELTGYSQGDGNANANTAVVVNCQQISYREARTTASASYLHIDFGINKHSALPVTLISFEAAKSSEGTLLKWQTAEEKDFDRFEIERSDDPRMGFSLIGQESGGQYSYRFTDYITMDRQFYYRLKMVDSDGSFRYSQIVTIAANVRNEQYAVYPNPTVDHNVYIRKAQKLESCHAYSISGTPVPVRFTELSDRYQLTFDRSVKPGFYVLEYRISGRSITQKLILK